jgi:catechol 2,3-dioxygenase-like lactoylglutathione lyase family enzyme
MGGVGCEPCIAADERVLQRRRRGCHAVDGRQLGMTITGIDHVQVAAPAGCENAARAFYGALLGLEELTKPEPLRARGGCWFRAGDQELHVGVEATFAPALKAHPGFVVADLDGLRARLNGAGIETRGDDSTLGSRRFFAADPFGNRLEFRQG